MNANGSTVRYMKVRQQVAWGFSLSGNDNHLCKPLSPVTAVRPKTDPPDENTFDAAYNLAVSR